jgi:hypothetical protein
VSGAGHAAPGCALEVLSQLRARDLTGMTLAEVLEVDGCTPAVVKWLLARRLVIEMSGVYVITPAGRAWRTLVLEAFRHAENLAALGFSRNVGAQMQAGAVIKAASAKAAAARRARRGGAR